MMYIITLRVPVALQSTNVHVQEITIHEGMHTQQVYNTKLISNTNMTMTIKMYIN